MENPWVEQFISSLAQSLNPGYPELISRLQESDRLATQWQVWCTDHIQRSIVKKYLLLNFHRKSSLAFQSKAAQDQKVETLRAQNACLLHKVQMANKKAMRYLEDLH